MTDDEILRDYLPWLRVVAGNLLGFDDPGLQDLVQEGYIAMWKAIRSYRPSSGKLDYWLKFKAHHRMLTLSTRSREKTQPDSLDAPYQDGLTLGDILEDVAAVELLDKIEIAYHNGQIAAAVGRLTPSQKKYVIARFWLGLTGNEMVLLGVFSYDPSALWNSKRNGARWKLQSELQHLATR